MVVLLKATKKKLMNLGYSSISCVVIKVMLWWFRAKDRAIFKLLRISKRYSLSFHPTVFWTCSKEKTFSVFIALDLTPKFVLRLEN